MATDDEHQINWAEIRRRMSAVDQSIGDELTDQQRRDLLARRARRYRQEEQKAVAETVDLVVFGRHDNRYAAPLEDLEEIRKVGDFQPVPGVSSVIAGIINVRGNIVAIHDLAAYCDHDTSLDDETWVVVGRGRDTLLALAADIVEGVVSPPSEQIRSVPLSLDTRHGEFQGVLEDNALVLDFEGLIRSDEFFAA